MYSMTGFGKGEMAMDALGVVVELKSVNHRFLDLQFRLPYALSFAEDYIRKTLQSAFSRGHIECVGTITVGDSTAGKMYTVDKNVAMSYVHMAKELSECTGVPNDISVKDLLRLPSVVVEEKNGFKQEELMLLLSVALESAVASLKDMRAKEGASLKQVLSNHLDVIAELVEVAKMRAPQVVEEYRFRLRERVKEYLGSADLDETRLLTELAVYADKVNVDEEINRLFSHIDQFEDMLEAVEPIGKKMDFLIQEMNREVNTLGSKANDSELLSLVVSLKNELEKMREQIQNIE